MKNNLIIYLVLCIALTCTFNAAAQYNGKGKGQKRQKYGYRKNKTKKFSKYSGGRVGYTGVADPKFTSFGVSINTTSYFGDLSPAPGKFSTNYLGAATPDGFGLSYAKVLYPGISFRGAFNYGQIKGSDYRKNSKVDSLDAGDKVRYA